MVVQFTVILHLVMLAVASGNVYSINPIRVAHVTSGKLW